MSEFERIVTMSPAWDKRHDDPKKNYGIHGVDLGMVLKGPKGATQFVLYTNWQLPHVTQETVSKALTQPLDDIRCEVYFMPRPVDLGYHWRTPQYEGQTTLKCDHFGECYYDGSSSQADKVYEILLREGCEGVWRKLEQVYRDLEAKEAVPSAIDALEAALSVPHD